MTDDDLKKIVQDHTGFPWFNGKAFAENKGYYALAVNVHMACDDLGDVIEMLRGAGHYAESDRIRTIRDRLRKDARKFKAWHDDA